MNYMEPWITIGVVYIAMLVYTIMAHIITGRKVRKMFAEKGMKDTFESYYSAYKKEYRSLSSMMQYLFYLIPVFNVILGSVELSNYKRTYNCHIPVVKQYERTGVVENPSMKSRNAAPKEG